jgi:hypothetical protein
VDKKSDVCCQVKNLGNQAVDDQSVYTAHLQMDLKFDWFCYSVTATNSLFCLTVTTCDLANSD